MPKIRDYANEETLKAALKKEGLDGLPSRIDPSEGGRVRPVFLLTIGNPEHDSTVTRLAQEGFAWEALHPGPAPERKDRRTFTVPEGHEAVRDAEGRATGETRPIVAASVVPVRRVAGDDFSAVATVYVPAEEVTRPRVINPHVSDLFFNYEHAGFATLEEAAEPEGAREAIRKDAEEFTASVLGAFGVAINVDELVEDFFARV